MIVLVTRPKHQAVATARELRAMGHRAIMDPMLVIRPFPHQPVDLDGVTGVLLTSANGAMGLTMQLASLPVYAVGQATATAATARGCRSISVARGDALALVELIKQSRQPGEGALVHLAGEDVREALQDKLQHAGYEYRRQTVYKAEAAARLGGRTEEVISRGQLDAALFYSPRTAETFAQLVDEADLCEQLGVTSAICLSDAVAEPLNHLPWSMIRVSPQRDQRSLLACLESLEQEC